MGTGRARIAISVTMLGILLQMKKFSLLIHRAPGSVTSQLAEKGMHATQVVMKVEIPNPIRITSEE